MGDARWTAPRAPPPGVFETVRCEAGGIGWLDAHLARMAAGARALGLAWPPPRDPGSALRERAARGGRAPRVARLEWSPPHLGTTERALVPPPERAVALLAPPGSVPLPAPGGVKTTDRAGLDAARARARRRGAFDVLVRTRAGLLVEGTIANVFAVVDGALWTPPLASGALPGIVRGAILT